MGRQLKIENTKCMKNNSTDWFSTTSGPVRLPGYTVVRSSVVSKSGSQITRLSGCSVVQLSSCPVVQFLETFNHVVVQSSSRPMDRSSIRPLARSPIRPWLLKILTLDYFTNLRRYLVFGIRYPVSGGWTIRMSLFNSQSYFTSIV